MKTNKKSNVKVKFLILTRLSVLALIFTYCTAFDEGCGGVEPPPVPLFSISHSNIIDGKVKFYFTPTENVVMSKIEVHNTDLNVNEILAFEYPYPIVLNGDKHIIKEYGDIRVGQSWDFTLSGVNRTTKEYFYEHYYITVR